MDLPRTLPFGSGRPYSRPRSRTNQCMQYKVSSACLSSSNGLNCFWGSTSDVWPKRRLGKLRTRSSPQLKAKRRSSVRFITQSNAWMASTSPLNCEMAPPFKATTSSTLSVWIRPSRSSHARPSSCGNPCAHATKTFNPNTRRRTSVGVFIVSARSRRGNSAGTRIPFSLSHAQLESRSSSGDFKVALLHSSLHMDRAASRIEIADGQDHVVGGGNLPQGEIKRDRKRIGLYGARGRRACGHILERGDRLRDLVRRCRCARQRHHAIESIVRTLNRQRAAFNARARTGSATAPWGASPGSSRRRWRGSRGRAGRR